MTLEKISLTAPDGEEVTSAPARESFTDRSARDPAPHDPAPRDPAVTLRGCQRILILGRTGSGKTTLARQLAAAIDVPHVELDALYFGPDFTTVPLPLLRERTSAAIAAPHWVTDGNKRAVRDLVWPRADTIIWLDYPLPVSLWRLGKRALRRTSRLTTQAAKTGAPASLSLPRQLTAAAKGVLTALRSHRGQRHVYPTLLADHHHLAVVRLRSPRATRRWLTRVTNQQPERPGEG